MALSVLHKTSKKNDCGVWCSLSKNWVFSGTSRACFTWKNSHEEAEQRRLFDTSYNWMLADIDQKRMILVSKK